MVKRDKELVSSEPVLNQIAMLRWRNVGKKKKQTLTSTQPAMFPTLLPSFAKFCLLLSN